MPKISPKIFLALTTAICGLFCGCTTSDECSVYDDAVKTMFFFSANDNRLYEQYGQSIGDFTHVNSYNYGQNRKSITRSDEEWRYHLPVE